MDSELNINGALSVGIPQSQTISVPPWSGSALMLIFKFVVFWTM